MKDKSESKSSFMLLCYYGVTRKGKIQVERSS